jgi:hypothetical protein
MSRIVLISCVKSKQRTACRAGDLYISPLFKKMAAYAESLRPDKIFILSAEYGLVAPDDVIAPYEKTLNEMNAGQRRIWAQDVLADLEKAADLGRDEFVFLAGKPYREDLMPHMKHCSVPMEGLPIGRQLQWLKKARPS